MDPYLAKLIAPAAREADEVPMLLKKYFKDDRVFIRIKGILPVTQYEMLLVEMEQIREQNDRRLRTVRSAAPPKSLDVPAGSAL